MNEHKCDCSTNYTTHALIYFKKNAITKLFCLVSWKSRTYIYMHSIHSKKSSKFKYGYSTIADIIGVPTVEHGMHSDAICIDHNPSKKGCLCVKGVLLTEIHVLACI